MSPTKKFFSGNTLEQAVLQAARFFQLDPGVVAYEPVERRHGFLKVRRRVVIGVDPDNPQREVQAPAAEGSGAPAPVHEQVSSNEVARSAGEGLEKEEAVATPRRRARKQDTGAAPAPERTSAGSEDRDDGEGPGDSGDAWTSLSPADAQEAAEEALRRLFRLGDLDLEAAVSTAETGLQVELRGSDEEQLFEDRGRLLLALQHLLPRMVRGLTGASVPCRVDSDNFHEVRAEQLRMLAQDAAAEVRRDGRMQTLEPMSPDERRIVHLTLAEDPAVETESHGTGLFKRVAVRPVRSGGERGRYSR